MGTRAPTTIKPTMTSPLSEFLLLWFPFIGDMSLLASVYILLLKMHKSRSCRGISFKTQALYLTVLLSRCFDMFFHSVSWSNAYVKLFFIGMSCYTLYLMRYKYWSTHDPAIDAFKVEYLVVPCLILGLIFGYKYSILEILWSFSVFLESVAILPQLFMLQRTGEAGVITTPYVAALGAYRACRILYLIFRYTTDGRFDPTRLIAGIVHFGLYLLFFYIYFASVYCRVDKSQCKKKPSEEKHSEAKV